MMAAIVLDAEMAVARHRIGEFRAPLVEPVGLVAELVPDGDGRARTHAGGDHQDGPAAIAQARNENQNTGTERNSSTR